MFTVLRGWFEIVYILTELCGSTLRAIWKPCAEVSIEAQAFQRGTPGLLVFLYSQVTCVVAEH